MLVILGAFIVNFLLKPFLQERYLTPIATLGGGALSPHLFSPETIIYPVPSPAVALAVVGCAMGFIGSVFHRRVDRWIRTRLMGGNDDTQQFARDSQATRSGAGRERHAPPSTPDAPNRCD